MKPKNLMLLGFINKAVDYLDKQLDDESSSTLAEVNNTDLKVLKEQLSDYLDVSLGSMQSTIETLLKAGGEAFDEFLEVGKQGSLSAELDKILNVDLENNSEEELSELLDFYGLNNELTLGEKISDEKEDITPEKKEEKVVEEVKEENIPVTVDKPVNEELVKEEVKEEPVIEESPVIAEPETEAEEPHEVYTAQEAQLEENEPVVIVDDIKPQQEVEVKENIEEVIEPSKEEIIPEENVEETIEPSKEEIIPEENVVEEVIEEKTPVTEESAPINEEAVDEETVVPAINEEVTATETVEEDAKNDVTEEYYDDLFVSDEVNEAEVPVTETAKPVVEEKVEVVEESLPEVTENIENKEIEVENKEAQSEEPVVSSEEATLDNEDTAETEFEMSEEDTELFKQIEENVIKNNETETETVTAEPETAEFDSDTSELDNILEEVVSYTENPDLGFDTSVHGPVVQENPGVDEVPAIEEVEVQEPEEENSINEVDKDDLLKMVQNMQSNSDHYYDNTNDFGYVPEEKVEEEPEEVEPVQENNHEEKDEGEIYVSSLINDLRAQMLKEDEDKVVAEEEYKQIFERIHKLYPYLSNSFVRSVYDLKESISNEYPLNIKVAVLHRLVFNDLESLRQFVEIAMNHEYNVTADEKKMIVDIFKPMINADGKIITSIFEVANQAALLNGEYDGYQVLYNR